MIDIVLLRVLRDKTMNNITLSLNVGTFKIRLLSLLTIYKKILFAHVNVATVYNEHQLSYIRVGKLLNLPD